MKVIVRTVAESTRRQEKFFGEEAWRPFLIVEDVFDEEELEEIVRAVIRGKKVEGVIKLCEYEGGKLQYSTIPFSRWVDLEI